MHMDYIDITRPDDMHIHLRQGNELEHYVHDADTWFGRVVVMPNTVPPIADAQALVAYRNTILSYATRLKPLMTFKIIEGMDSDRIASLKQAGAVAGKYYPQGVTTNSSDGVLDFRKLYSVFACMQEQNLVLSIHGEAPGVFCLRREQEFIPIMHSICSDFPRLRIVLEHLSTKEAVDFVLRSSERVCATITVHHLLLTLDDILGDGINPHAFCKPILKTPEDREALQAAVLSGNPKFFFGSDSAPHPKRTKECSNGASGIYSIPVAVPLLAGFFEENSRLDLLENFTSGFGASFYGLPRNTERIRLVRSETTIPETYHGIVPLLAGNRISWKLFS